MPDVLRLDVIKATTPLEVKLLAELAATRRELSRLKPRPPKPKFLQPPPEPKPEPKPVVKLVPAEKPKTYRGPPAREAGIKRIQLAVCRKFGITMNEMKGPHRQRKIAEARHVAVMLCYALTPHSYPFIGRWFSYRDHSTMLNSVKVMRDVHDQLVKELRSDDPLFDWVDLAHQLVTAGRATKDPVETVVNIAQERAAYAQTSA